MTPTADELMKCIAELGHLRDSRGIPLTKIVEWIKLRDGIPALIEENERLGRAYDLKYELQLDKEKELESLKAERDKYRAALEEIAGAPYRSGVDTGIAREALKSGESK